MLYGKHARWMAGIAGIATMLGALVPTMAQAAPANRPSVSGDTSALREAHVHSKLSDEMTNADGTVTAFIQTKGTSGLEAKTEAESARSGMSAAGRAVQSRSAAHAAARQSENTTQSVLSQLKSLDGNAQTLYTTPYILPGAAVTADADALRALAERNASVIRITKIHPRTATTASTADATKEQPQLPQSSKPSTGEAPANIHSDSLVNALKTWNQTGTTGKGVNIAIVDTGLDYTHADFGGAGTEAAYQTALSSTADPLSDGTLSKLLDKSKFKGGYDFAGADYDPDGGDSTPKPDGNPIDGPGGHHGTHVAGTAAGYGVTGNGTSFKGGDYSKLSAKDIAGWQVGPGSAPEAGIYALKVFGDNGGTTGLVMDALNWVAEHNIEAADSSDRINIVSMSLGGSFGSSDDPENIAVNTLNEDGVLSVIAAGNDGDVTDIAGAPGTAASALTVAASASGKAWQDAITVNTPDALHGAKLAGQYSVNYAKLDDFNLTADVARVKSRDNLDGCQAYSAEDAAAVKGKIAYVDWDDSAVNCGSKVRFDNAEKAGAVGIMFASQSNIPEAGIAGNADIPGFQLVKNAAENDKVQQAIDDGTLNVTFSSDLRMGVDSDYSQESEDTIASFTSRGIHGSYDGTVKPDVAAPGVGIISASAGTGTKPEVMSGTSMATPLTSGVAALVSAAHPDWSASQVKEQIMNTADHDVLTADRKTAYGPLRVGTGRIDAYAAVKNDVQVSSDDQTAVTGQFGVVQVPKSGYTAKKTFTVRNWSKTTRTYKVAYEPRTNVPGVAYTTSTNSVTIGPRGTATFDVTLNVDQSRLRHVRDTTQADKISDKTTSYVTDASGVVELTPADGSDLDSGDGSFGLRVAVSCAPKPVSDTQTTLVRTGKGTRGLRVSGNGIAQGDTADAWNSRAYPMVLSATDPVDVDYGDASSAAQRSLAAADIRAIGYSSTAPQLNDPSQGVVNFAVVTDKTWSRLGNTVAPTVLLDTNLDATPDYAIMVSTNADSTQYDTAWADTYKVENTSQGLTASALVDQEPIDDAFISDSNQVVLSTKLSALGYKSTDKTANMMYAVQMDSAYSAGDDSTVDTAGGDTSAMLDGYDPDLSFGDKTGSNNGVSAFVDNDGTIIPIHESTNTPSTVGNRRVLTLHADGQQPDRADQNMTLDVDGYDANKAKLKSLVARFSTLKESDYTKDSWTAFAAALKAAQDVLADGNATQGDVDNAYNALQKAYDELAYNVPATVNKGKLEALVKQAEQLKESDYTKDSWAMFAAALNNAKKLLADGNATQDGVDAAEQQLDAAINALQKNPSPKPKPNPGAGSAGAAGNSQTSGTDSGQNGSASVSSSNHGEGSPLGKTGNAVANIGGATVALAIAGIALLKVRRGKIKE